MAPLESLTMPPPTGTARIKSIQSKVARLSEISLSLTTNAKGASELELESKDKSDLSSY